MAAHPWILDNYKAFPVLLLVPALLVMLAGPLIALAPRIIASAAQGAQIVLSGLLAEQADEVARAYRATCREAGVAVQDGWARLAFVRRPAADA